MIMITLSQRIFQFAYIIIRAVDFTVSIVNKSDIVIFKYVFSADKKIPCQRD